MHAEIVAVGSELTTGAKLDTNSQWLSLALADRGIPTHFHTTVADDLAEMTGVLRAAVDRSDLVLVTGGLGPTLDDLTRQALAELMQRELVLHEPSLKHIRGLFARRNRPMPERNRIQAMFPEGCEPIFNPRGTAPGIWMTVSRNRRDGDCLLAAMPGVPSEMKRMFQSEVGPRLPRGDVVIRRARVNCFGIGESTAEELLGELTARGRDPEVGITVHEATITLRVTAHGTSADDCDRKIVETKREIRERLGTVVFGEEDDELEHVVMRLLGERGQSLATAESGTGGLLCFRLSETRGHRDCYSGGLVAANEQSLLSLLEAGGTVSPASRPRLARIAAEATRRRFSADYALAVLDCPDFDPDDTQQKANSTFVALAASGDVKVAPVTLFGDPAIRKSRTVKAALDLLRTKLAKI
ncbi:MAG: CinA family nicotinamide mononucleotide deamidase-related protein [Planctomycetaceae bacterium]